MFRDQALVFYRIGRQIERADQITRLVDIKYHRLLPKTVPMSARRSMSVSGMRCFAPPPPIKRIGAFIRSGMTPKMVAGFLLFQSGILPAHVRTCMSRQLRELVDELAAIRQRFRARLASTTVRCRISSNRWRSHHRPGHRSGVCMSILDDGLQLAAAKARPGNSRDLFRSRRIADAAIAAAKLKARS